MDHVAPAGTAHRRLLLVQLMLTQNTVAFAAEHIRPHRGFYQTGRPMGSEPVEVKPSIRSARV